MRNESDFGLLNGGSGFFAREFYSHKQSRFGCCLLI
jgi:hypothetical protein